MGQISKKEFEAIFAIEFMNCNDPKCLSSSLGINNSDAIKLLEEFENRDWISIEYRGGKIYGSKLTGKGKEIWNDDEKYMDWKEEFGY